MKAKTAGATSALGRTGAWNLVVAGYAVAAVGLLINLVTIGSSSSPAAVSIGVPGLIVLGIVTATAGLLLLRRGIDRDRSGVKRGLAMQSLGLVDLLLGVLAIEISSYVSDRGLPPLAVEGLLFASAAFVVSASALAIAGGLLLRDHYSDVGARSATGSRYLILGTALMFAGVGVVVGSKTGYYFVLSDVTSTVVNAAGVAVSACGCVVAAYASFVMSGPSPVSQVQAPKRCTTVRHQPRPGPAPVGVDQGVGGAPGRQLSAGSIPARPASST